MNKRHRSTLMVIFVSLFFFAIVEEARSDQVILENGDSLSGTVEKMVEGKLTLKTDYAGSVGIDISKIKKITTSSPVEVHLQNNEVLKGQLKTTEDGRVMVEGSDGRETTSFDWKKVASLNPPPTKWTGSVTVGANDQTGNTSRNGVAIAFDASRKTEKDRFGLGYQFNYASEHGAVTSRNHYGYMKYDYFFTKKLYGYLGTELLSDTFRDLRLRVAVGPGAGYQIWDDPKKFLNAEAGLSYINESRITGEDQDFLSLRVGGNFRYNILKFLIFSDKVIVYPRLDHLGRYILHNEAVLAAPLSSVWAMKLTNIIDRDSNPSPGRLKNDIQWIFGLQYSF